jgi:hypothetical protein
MAGSMEVEGDLVACLGLEDFGQYIGDGML